MAGNVRMSRAGGGPMIATDQISNVHYPRYKMGFGASGSYGDVSADHPLPVSLLGFSALAPLPVSLGSATIPVSIQGNSAAAPLYVALPAGALPVSLPVSPLPVSLPAGALTVTWPSALPVSLPASPLLVTLPAGALSVQEVNPASSSPGTLHLARAKSGTAFTWSSGIIGLTAILVNLRVLLENPAGSGKTIYITSIAASSTASVSGMAKIIENPTTGLPTTAIGGQNNSIGGGFGASTMKIGGDASVTAISGGTTRGALVIVTGRTKIDDAPIVLKAGQTLGITALFALTLALTAQAEVSFAGWVE